MMVQLIQNYCSFNIIALLIFLTVVKCHILAA